ncbi:MAG: YggT family protein [Blastocatellia bacterium]
MNLLVLALYWLSWIITAGTIIFAGLFFLRVILKWMNVNPFAKIPYHLTRITEPMVRPLRAQFAGPTLRYDLIPLLMGIMILVVGLFIASMLGQLGAIMQLVGFLVNSGQTVSSGMLAALVRLLGLLYVVAIFLRLFLPFFGVGYMNRFFRFLFVITEPLLKPLRRFLVFGMFDFSPIVAMFLVQLLVGLIANAIAGVG